MDNKNRNEIIIQEIEKAKKELLEKPYLCGFGSHSDIFKLKNGKKAQIYVVINTDEEDFEEPTNTFI